MKNIAKIIYLLLIILNLDYSYSEDSFILYNNIDDTIKLSKEFDRPALIIFSADWCKHCNSLKNDFSNKKIVETDSFIVCIIDTDFDAEYAKKFNVKILPTSIILQNNKEKDRKIGYINNEYKTWLQKQK